MEPRGLVRPLSGRCQLEKRTLQPSSQIGIRLPELTEQLCCSGTKRPPEFGRRQRPNERVFELRRHLGGQIIHPLRIACRLIESKAGKRERMVSDAADPVLGLPQLVPLNTDPSVQNMVPCQPYEVVSVWLRHSRALDRLAENQPKVRSERTKLCCWRKCQIDLEAFREKEGAIDCGARLEVKMMQGAKLLVHELAPIAEDLH